MRFTIHNTVDEQFYFNLKDADGRKLLTSRNYRRLSDCANAIYMMQQYRDFEVAEDPQQEICCYRLCLKSLSGKVIAKSGKYYSSSLMRNDKERISSELPKATVEDHVASVRFFRPVTR